MINTIPNKSLSSSWFRDAFSGFSVFLIALPLCLSIAVFSHVPPLSGIIAGVIGGIVVGFLSRSKLGISGPANSTAILIAEGIRQLSILPSGELNFQTGFHGVLVALFLAGVFQIIFSLFKTGNLSHFIPSAVIKGMLAGIGLKLILHQIPSALGFPGNCFILDFEPSFLAKIIHPFTYIHAGAILISFFSIGFLILFNSTWIQKKEGLMLRKIPPIFIVTGLAIGINYLFEFYLPHLHLSGDHLIKITRDENLHPFNDFFVFLDGNFFMHPTVWLLALSLALVASLETLITIEATEKLDVQKNKKILCVQTDHNRELWVQGVGNIISSFFGGLPLTQTIIRTSANIDVGATSKMSSIFQGAFLLLSIFVLSDFINKIPLSVLASVLIVVGYRLASLKLFKQMYHLSRDQFLTFIFTILGILYFNLMGGIVLGIVISLIYIIKNMYSSEYFTEVIQENDSHTLYIRLGYLVSFLSKRKAIEQLRSIPEHIDNIVIDASKTKYIDYDVIEVILDFEEQERSKGIHIELIDIERRINLTRPIDQATQNLMQAKDVIRLLKEGNQRFMSGQTIHKDNKQSILDTKSAQSPMAIILSCIDSRVPVETVFDLGIGHIFTTRIAGNVISGDVISSMEYACKYAGAKLIVILGHTQCGAVKSAIDGVKDPSLQDLLNKIQPAIQQCISKNVRVSVDHVARLNVGVQKKETKKRSATLREMINQGQIQIVGAMYNIETGVVDFLEPEGSLAQEEQILPNK